MFGHLWNRFCDLAMVSRPVEKGLMDKAMEVAERVRIKQVTEEGLLQGCCPVCSGAILSAPESDVRMLLAAHFCDLHPVDVYSMWDKMADKKEPEVVRRPSFIFAVGMAAGVLALTGVFVPII
ncbi:PREDICTED: uncharacterized protein LOC109149594 [Ipomoea nil]|uniref:uncharacterized protein LOC109149594 n=1 Tax=Ipomoea nil TaxID=35883 RepID=UPI000900CACF|nr:PREDICTED: uncharacterized protein LOC109149594 [Ipomoea nil]